MAVANNPIEGLSLSSKKALHWAEVMSRLRSEQSDESDTQSVNIFDLFVGVLLSHPEDSEAKILLNHFKLHPGQILPEDYPLPDVDSVQRLAPLVSTDGVPDLDSTVAEAVEVALKEGANSGSPEVAELSALYVGMLAVSSPLSTRIGGLISSRGAELTALNQLNLDYLSKTDERGGYAGLLSNRLPYNQEPVRIPTYKADHGAVMNLTDDLVDIRAEVDAFAYLLASRSLKPPMAVGLFGDWGSGKTFFMDSVKSRIIELAATSDAQEKKQKNLPFWKRIIQIDFNAWHYVEGDLWASLVDHIFNQLKISGEDEDLAERRKKFWTEKLEKRLVKLTNLEEQKEQAANRLKAKQKEIKEKKEKRDQEVQAVEKLKADSMQDIILEQSVADVKSALEPLMVSVGLPSPDSVADYLREARAELTRGRALVHYFQDPRSRKALTLILLLIVGTPFLVWWINSQSESFALNVATGVSSTLVAAFGLLGSVTKWVRDRFDSIFQAEKKVEEEITRIKTEWQRKLDDKNKELEQVEAELDELVGEEENAKKDIIAAEEEIKNITTARVLNDFVAERAGSDDYRSRLGVPALIQKDFKELTALISKYNEECVSNGGGSEVGEENADYYFNRVILYIDDLDRCPDKRVVEVLQAVHLLLAFELFVVVVAVDSRWLNHALKQHYPALTSFNGDRSKATSEDYLEKIFQIPFWVRSLNVGARKNIVAGLLKGNLEPREVGDVVESINNPLKVGEAEAQVLKSFDGRTAPPAIDIATLTVTKPELDFLDQLAPLLGDTPRSVKRFVNLYQLVRIVSRSSGANATAQNALSEQSKLAFLLAISDGLTHLFPDFMASIYDAETSDTISTVAKKLSEDSYPDEHKQLITWIDEHNEFKNALAEDFENAAGVVERFIFRSRFRA
jgi:peptidoglycan hydrolase CwlO-like protein